MDTFTIHYYNLRITTNIRVPLLKPARERCVKMGSKASFGRTVLKSFIRTACALCAEEEKKGKKDVKGSKKAL